MQYQAKTSPNYKDLILADRVHGSIYTDPQIFEDEMERIFHRGWVFVGHESEIPNKGDFRARKIGRQPIIFVRGDDDKVRVLMNRCTHRGPLVCPHERGNTRHFTCAYHGWSFRNTGKLMGVPYDDRYDDSFSKDEFNLRPAPRQESYRGFMFASVAATGPSLDEHLGPLVKAEIDVALDLSPVGEIETVAGVHKYGYNGNWKLQLENSVDSYHIPYLHRSYANLVKERTGVDAVATSSSKAPTVVRSLGNGHIAWDFSALGKVNFLNFDDDAGWQAQYQKDMIANHGEERARFLLKRRFAHVAIFPNVVLIANQIRMIRPIAVDKTEVFLSPTLLKGVPPEMTELRLRGHESFYGPAGGGATDDLEVFERMTAGLQADVDPWILMSRGMGREYTDGTGALAGQVTDELSNRAILHHWQKMMIAGAHAGLNVVPEVRRHA
jgi:phenylpropionate dioxygenase-like ring-hydroxylating dioxygenase large terminal subunit